MEGFNNLVGWGIGIFERARERKELRDTDPSERRRCNSAGSLFYGLLFPAI
jgi:hypothetical protein